MSSKSLSTSTLSLRFMQNAHRAKQMKEVELDRAEVKDDGEWEVSQAVKDAWGLPQGAQSLSTDVHEASYLPFLFSEKGSVLANDDSPAADGKKSAGRRVFNKKGEEVFQPSVPTMTVAQESSAPESSATARKVHPRPISISASGTSGQLRGFDQLKRPKDSKTARQAVFENGGVGTDLRTQARKNGIPPTPTTFMKPVGVDDPKDIKATELASRPLPTDGEIVDGARRKPFKRERDAATDGASETVKKSRSKKKKVSE
ncbi:hypothetical protein B0H34DRAFT_662075 [Crassisporium funariophilum]|nr:hypothetical protein B0H34DRAFT_662075 [Crassisporium funariophilum]